MSALLFTQSGPGTIQKSAGSSRILLDIPEFPSENVKFTVGDKVRAYSCAFDNNKPFKNDFIEGVVIATSDKVLGEGYLVVKWHIKYYFGVIYKFRMPDDNSDTFTISVQSPWLVKINKHQLSLAL